MKTKCPSCGATASLDVLLSNDGAREAITAALQLPAPLGKLLIQYLGLFRPKERDLSFDRVAKLLGELLPMINDGHIERGGRAWPAPLPAWKEALEQMLIARDKLQLPMKSHGYLLEIIAGMGNRVEAAAEEKREQERRTRSEATAHQEKKSTEAQRTSPPASFLEAVRAISGGMKLPGGDKRSFEAKRQDTLKALENPTDEDKKNGTQTN